MECPPGGLLQRSMLACGDDGDAVDPRRALVARAGVAALAADLGGRGARALRGARLLLSLLRLPPAALPDDAPRLSRRGERAAALEPLLVYRPPLAEPRGDGPP